ncbi:MAG: hypothetical protein KDC10_05265 [Calditrichaeota bacterium]|nr:hypothetical protein [Candidatus Cloacimonadota bacterium]MCB1046592.1 hypothetical protein [Calditrichota bacterium]
MSAWHPMTPEARHYQHRLEDPRIHWPDRERVLARQENTRAWSLFVGKLMGSWLLLGLVLSLPRLLI